MMENKEFYKKRLKIIRKNISESPFYSVPSWPFKKVIDILGSGVAKVSSIKAKKTPIARFMEYNDDNNSKTVRGREKIYTYEDMLDGILKGMSEVKDQNDHTKLKFTPKFFKETESSNDIKDLIDGEIHNLLKKDNDPKNKIFKTHFKDESNERVKVSNRGIIDYSVVTNKERGRVANQLCFFVQKYLEKKPEDKQFIEKEDLEGPDDSPGPLKKYIEDKMKRDELSYRKVGMLSAAVLMIGVTTTLVALANPIGVAIGSILIAIAVLSVVGAVVYKNKERSLEKLTKTIQDEDKRRFEEMKQEVEQEKMTRKEEKERGKTSTGANPGQYEIPVIREIQEVPNQSSSSSYITAESNLGFFNLPTLSGVTENQNLREQRTSYVENEENKKNDQMKDKSIP